MSEMIRVHSGLQLASLGLDVRRVIPGAQVEMVAPGVFVVYHLQHELGDQEVKALSHVPGVTMAGLIFPRERDWGYDQARPE